MKNLLLSIFYRKSKLYRFLSLISLCCLGSLIFYIAKNAKNIEAPLGLFSNKNNQIIVEVTSGGEVVEEFTDSTDKSDTPTTIYPENQTVKKFKVGTPIYLLEEDLVLIGYIANVEEKDTTALFSLEVKKEFQEQVFYEETEYNFLINSPSSMIVLQRFFQNPQFTAEMQKDFDVLAGKQKYLMGNVLERVQDRLSRTMEINKVNAVYTDPFIRERLWKALEENIIAAIDWDIVTKNIKQHDGAKMISQVLGENLYKRKFVWQGIKGVFGNGVMNNITQEALRQGSNILKVEETRKVLLDNGQDLAVQAIEDTQISKKSYNFFMAIKQDSELHRYVKETYGIGVWDTLLESLQDSMENEKDTITAMKTSLEEFAKKWLEFIMLNDKKDGPNPIMLLAVKEAISGQKSIVMCSPTKGEKVAAGYVYKVREE